MTPAIDEQIAETHDTAGHALGGKYLTFHVAQETYGLDILAVREIINLTEITRVPQAADFVEGLINLRGKVVPVIDLRTRFAMPRATYDDQTCIIIVEVNSTMGIIVDRVNEVYDVADADVAPPPQHGRDTLGAAFILGLAKVGDDITILIDIDKVLTGEEFVRLRP